MNSFLACTESEPASTSHTTANYYESYTVRSVSVRLRHSLRPLCAAYPPGGFNGLCHRLHCHQVCWQWALICWQLERHWLPEEGGWDGPVSTFLASPLCAFAPPNVVFARLYHCVPFSLVAFITYLLPRIHSGCCVLRFGFSPSNHC